MLAPYRRHLSRCPDRKKGQHFTLCKCPVWAYGKLPNGEVIRRSLQTSDWDRARRRIEILESGKDGEWFVPESTSLGLRTAADRYLENAKARNLRQSSIESYTNTLDH